MLNTYQGQYPEVFVQPPGFPSLNILLAYLGLNVPGSDVEHHAQLLLSHRQQLVPTETESGSEKGWVD